MPAAVHIIDLETMLFELWTAEGMDSLVPYGLTTDFASVGTDYPHAVLLITSNSAETFGGRTSTSDIRVATGMFQFFAKDKNEAGELARAWRDKIDNRINLIVANGSHLCLRCRDDGYPILPLAESERIVRWILPFEIMTDSARLH